MQNESLPNIDRLVGLADFAEKVNRTARAERYQFAKVKLIDLHALRISLEQVGARSRDTIYKALIEHIALRERSAARRTAGFKKMMRSGGVR